MDERMNRYQEGIDALKARYPQSLQDAAFVDALSIADQMVKDQAFWNEQRNNDEVIRLRATILRNGEEIRRLKQDLAFVRHRGGEPMVKDQDFWNDQVCPT
jgi:hypothetical protein